jgi:hypothetical protein
MHLDTYELALPTHGFEQVELAGMSFVFEVNGVIATEASIAKTSTLAVEVGVHPFSTKIGESVGFNEAADLFDRT